MECVNCVTGQLRKILAAKVEQASFVAVSESFDCEKL